MPGPGNQRAMVGWGDSEIGLEFFEYVRQRRWRGHTGPDRERQTMRLSRTVVGILPEDHDPHVGVRSEVERSEDLIGWWVDRCFCPLVGNERLQLRPVGLVELVAQ